MLGTTSRGATAGGGACGDPHHTDDSGIGIDAEYDADGASEHSGGSGGGSASNSMVGGGGFAAATAAYHQAQARGQGQGPGQGRRNGGFGGHHQQQRLPGVDMGIDSIINGPRGR